MKYVLYLSRRDVLVCTDMRDLVGMIHLVILSAGDCTVMTTGPVGQPAPFTVDDLTEALARCDLPLVSYERIEEGVHSVFAVETGLPNRSVVVKAFTCSNAPGNVTTEALLYQQVAKHTSIPVPAVIAFELATARRPSYLVLEKVRGEHLDGDIHSLPPAVLDRLYYEAGAYLGELHATFELDSFGGVTVAGGTLMSDGSVSTWADKFDAVVAPRIHGMSSGPFASYHSDVERLFARTRHVFDDVDRPVVVHGDYRLGNMLITPATADAPVAAILDWECAFVGHHEYDLARAEYMMIEQQLGDSPDTSIQPRLRTRLFDGYHDRFSFPNDERVETRRHVYRAANILLQMWAFPVLWDGHSRTRRATVANGLERQLQHVLSTVN